MVLPRGGGADISRDPIEHIFSALGDATRRSVLACLSDLGQASATEISQRVPVTRQAVMKHLEALSEAGLVTSTREGRTRMYRPTPEPLAEAMTWMADVGAAWDERLAALRDHLGRPN